MSRSFAESPRAWLSDKLAQNMDRGQFNREASLMLLGLINVAIVFPIVMVVSEIESQRFKRSAFGKYLASEDKQFQLTDQPQILHINFVPTNTGIDNKPEIVLRQEKPYLDAKQKRLDPKDMEVEYGVPVFGESYRYGDPKKPFATNQGRFSIDFKGRTIDGGQWLMLTDQEGNPVDPQGQKIDSQKEKPFFTANNFNIIE